MTPFTQSHSDLYENMKATRNRLWEQFYQELNSESRESVLSSLGYRIVRQDERIKDIERSRAGAV